MDSNPESKKDSAALRARALKLRQQIKGMNVQKPAAGPSRPESPAGFVRRRMSELEQKPSKSGASPTKKKPKL
jgi:hypothetical protein